ncbi:ATP-grasp peptide maturase system methyltransferase [Streptomyces sp. SPB074]|uniref:ATP-grasp peptide maturase system methyltransferase n=1 Tax=Streptomyces sp. (strain SPB074) TaxID=465543 RepID=UPI00017FF3BD|nr:ATP-grasp peptide maturase system methyltransferase [Streptomyces sp. SPB074]
MSDMTSERLALAARMDEAGVFAHPEWRRAVEAVPRELFLRPGVFVPDEVGRWSPVPADRIDPALAYSDQSLVTQLDDALTTEDVSEAVWGTPTSSSTVPSLVVDMLGKAGIERGHKVLEIGTGTGYSTALMCHWLGADAVTTVEVDPGVAWRAHDALRQAGYEPETETGDGLLGHPAGAPYDRLISTCAVRRVPYAWVRQVKAGGDILTTLGSWPNGSGLLRLTVHENGSATGNLLGHTSFMQARAQVPPPVAADLTARTAYADTDRMTDLHPSLLLGGGMPAFLAQLTAPGSQVIQATGEEPGVFETVLVDAERESYAQFRPDGEGWRVRQGGPVPLWDEIERLIRMWQSAGSPGIETVRVRVTEESHTYRVADDRNLYWLHRLV